MKVYNIYDVFGLNDTDFDKVVYNVFADPVTDVLHYENPAKSSSFAMEFLPGQYDQRADSAQQCIVLLTENTQAKVRSGKLVEIEGINKEELQKVKDLLINRVESQEKDLSKLEIPKEEMPKEVVVYNDFITLNESQLKEFYTEQNFAFGLDDLAYIQDYFKSEQRNPTETELKVLDTYWSDHCRHTTFETELKDIRFEGQFKATLEHIFKDYLEKERF